MNNKNKGITYIGADMSLEGDMSIKGPAIIAGKTKGRITSSHHINIDIGGQVEGEIFCQEIRVSGTFKGKLHCNKLVIVSSGVVDGEVASHQMEIYDGGQFIGMRTKGPESSELPLSEHGDAATDMPQMTKSPTQTSSKWAYAAVAGAIVLGGVLLLPKMQSAINSPETAAAQLEHNSPALDHITEDAAALLYDVEQQSAFAEQREELIGAGQSDINTAMEDLHALEHANQSLAETDDTSVSEDNVIADSSLNNP
ncbi:polymer-forming cytoskeletal protein [Shewanella basaltis]|uniref:bactofilin family protein n=1 Tax=Shewanella basaltis TaxID=472183 RepID=UPI002010C510|nr:polymer-forming cytoskeletal protein [Shewanella basaltis]